MSAPYARFLDIATTCADAAGDVLRRYFRQPIGFDTKADASPVTIADRESEAVMRAIIEREAPDHGILGEEMETVNRDAEYVWVLDPIDGTKSFITGKPTFGILIALAHRGSPVIGIIDQPIIHERWIGRHGEPTTFNGTPAKARSCGDISAALLYATSPDMFRGTDAAPFARVRDRVQHPLYGADCYAYGLLASGYTDVVVEADLKPYDYAALVPVVEGAGGTITDWDGKPLTLASDGRVAAAGDARVHAEVIEILRSD